MSGMGKAPGLSGASQASCQAERNCLQGLPVRALERTVSREVAWTIFSRKVKPVSASVVANQIEPVHAPCAPMAMQPAIC